MAAAQSTCCNLPARGAGTYRAAQGYLILRTFDAQGLGGIDKSNCNLETGFSHTWSHRTSKWEFTKELLVGIELLLWVKQSVADSNLLSANWPVKYNI